MKKHSANEIVVMDKVIADIESFIDVEDYGGNLSVKEIILLELENAKAPTDATLWSKTDRLVEGGFFRIYNHDIVDLLLTLNLNDNLMKQAEQDPFKVYKAVMYHAIKRLIR